ncbi:MAG TPA: YbgC/FadM family acyl-CoA thioesterase [Campylobacteraceae bacterium]|nr:YbgC/FadM family acyl-CoA thioesterase [Campylobacteraceae bacterium]
MKIRVYYKDTDCGGIVYHARYLDFCEMARSELFFSRGKSPTRDGCHFAIKKIEADYIAPAKLGEMLEVRTQPAQIKHTSFSLHHEIYRDEKLLFAMDIVLVNLCQDGRPHAIHEEDRAFFKQLMA